MSNVYLDAYLDFYIELRLSTKELDMKYLKKKDNNFPDITIEIKITPMTIRQYINIINRDIFYGGELEIKNYNKFIT